MNRNQHRESRKVKKSEEYVRTKEQDETPETDPNEREISDLLDEELKIMVIKMITEVRITMYETK